jgi:glucose-6-phosphate isomerase
MPFLKNGSSELSDMNFVPRLWSKDAALWKTDEAHRKIINNSLGWLDLPVSMAAKTAEVTAFAQEARREFTDCVVMGMGGSSLAPEVMARLFPKKEGWPKLHVIDSTDPGWILRTAASINMPKTLFIFSSKSGGTVEPNSFFKYFYGEVEKISSNPSAQFIAITDPGTSLEKFAKGLNFRKIFQNPPDVGGRFSALSLFGLVPAALAGLDIKLILERAAQAAQMCRNADIAANPGVALGAIMGACANQGKDKMTLLCPAQFYTFGLWVEQLVAESTGKEGKGIVPIAGEEASEKYGNDRLFVHLKTAFAPDAATERLARELEDKGLPVFTMEMSDIHDLGAQYLIWEVATAAAGAVMRINPFDQPNVQEAKTMAQNALKELSSKKDAPANPEITFTLSHAACEKLCGVQLTPDNFLPQFAALAKTGDYCGLLAYLDGNAATDVLLRKLRTALLKTTKAATLFGYGPRYLHSTGQLHKGGAANGIYVVLTAAPAKDAPIPSADYTFAQLEYAQASGDFKALDAKDRRAVWIHLGKNPAAVLGEVLAGH